MVLQCAGDNFAGRGRALVDQHHQRHCLESAFGRVMQSLEWIRTGAPLVKLGRCLVGELALWQLPIGRDHGYVFWQKSRRQGHCSVEVATGVIAQVKHQALELGVLLVDFFGLSGEVFHSAFLELADPDPAITGFNQFAPHRLGANLVARDGDRETAVLGPSQDGQDHLGVGLAAHALDGLIECQPLDQGLVDLADQVTGLEPGAVCWRTLNRGNDFDQALFHGNLNANADKLAGGALVKLLKCFLVEVLRVRVQAGHHADNGIGDQLFIVDGFDVIAFDHAKHGSELLKLLKRQRSERTPCHGLQ